MWWDSKITILHAFANTQMTVIRWHGSIPALVRCSRAKRSALTGWHGERLWLLVYTAAGCHHLLQSHVCGVTRHGKHQSMYVIFSLQEQEREKKVLMFWRRIYTTPETGWSNFGTLDQFPGDYVHKTEFTGIDQNERLNRETQHQNTTRPCHSTHEIQQFSRLRGNKFFHLFHVKIFMSADIYQSDFLNYCPFWAFFDLRLTVLRILHKYSSLHPFNRLFGISQ